MSGDGQQMSFARTALIGIGAGVAACGVTMLIQRITANEPPEQTHAKMVKQSGKGYVPKNSAAAKKLDLSNEATFRMKPALVPPTPADAELQQKKLKGSLAYVSAVAQALSEMQRDPGADPFMDMAVEEASMGVVTREGGPFGAVITQTDEDGVEKVTVVSRAHNMVLQTNDPTAHAEVTCIRKAAARLGSFDLSDCTLYTSCYPCPMCYGAIHWAKIGKCVYAASPDDAAAAGFDDAFIYESIRGTSSTEHCEFLKRGHQGALDVFHKEYDPY